MKRYKYVAFMVVAVIICFLVLFHDRADKKTESNREVISSETESDKEESDKEEISSQTEPLKETSGGFYLYDKEMQPIMNDQSIDIGAGDSLELNIKCVNTCEVELNYNLVVLVNDCYQEVLYEGDSGVFQGTGSLQKGSSEVINAKFKISSNNRTEHNELRMIMFYYPNEIPQDDLDQVVVGESIGVYPIEGSVADNAKHDNELNDMTSHAVNAEQGVQAIWLTEKECDDIPKFDFTLEGGNPIYFNSLGEQKNYVGMIFVDGIPVKINQDYVFTWKQLKNHLLNYRIDNELDGKTMFAYMYEQGARPEETYVTNLYKLNHE